MLYRSEAIDPSVTEFHEDHERGASYRTWRRNGQTVTWKTRPAQYRVPVKFGLYRYGQIFQGGELIVTGWPAYRVHAASGDCPDRLRADGSPCAYPGCLARYAEELQRQPGPHNDPPGHTGWYWVPDVDGPEDEELPAHEHVSAESFLTNGQTSDEAYRDEKAGAGEDG